MSSTEETWTLFAKTLAGLEPLLAKELEGFGMKNINPVTRGVEFETDYRGLVLVNLASRFAVRVLLPWWSGTAKDPDELYAVAKTLPWDGILSLDQTFSIGSTVHSEGFPHSQYAGLKLKDAIADYFVEKIGARPSVDKDDPDLRIDLQIFEDKVRISLDSTGESLHRRGYRPGGAKAPLNECLAAAMIELSGWTPDIPLHLPMCGSGTLVMEAAMRAANLPSQWFRPTYGFMKWPNYDRKVAESVRVELWQKRVPSVAKIFASDKDRDAVQQTLLAVSKMSWANEISVSKVDFFELPAARTPGILILNPPYGERLKEENIEALYRLIGQKLKGDFAGSTAWIISSNLDAIDHLGFRPDKKEKLFNGQLECRYLGFQLYGGSRKKRGDGKQEAPANNQEADTTEENPTA
jgi:putative N6-adenine-specific DNA methylase